MTFQQASSLSSIRAAVLHAAGALEPAHPELNKFISLLFRDTGDAELKLFKPDQLAAIARSAFEFFRQHDGGEARVRIYDHPVPAGSPRVSIIEMVNGDMPFLLDTMLGEIRASNLDVLMVAHPVIHAIRDASGELLALDGIGGTAESFIHVQVRRIEDEMAKASLAAHLVSVLKRLRAAIADGPAIVARLQDCIAAYETAPPLPPAMPGETIQFLKWLADGNFIFLGARWYELTGHDGAGQVRPRMDTALGVLRDPAFSILRGGAGADRARTPTPSLVALYTANAISDVYARAHLDTVVVRTYGPDGTVSGELRLTGFFSPAARIAPVFSIPLIREKAGEVMRRAAYPENSHSSRALSYTLETLPRRDLMQAPVEVLYEWASQIEPLSLYPRTRVFVREDELGRFVSIMVYIMRDRYNTLVRERICAFLTKAFAGRMATFTPFFPDNSPMVRLHVVIWPHVAVPPRHPQDYLEGEVEKIVRTWRDELRDRLTQYYGDAAPPKIAKYLEAFPAGYRDTIRPDRALADIWRLETLSPENPTAIEFYSDKPGHVKELRATLLQIGKPITLSRRVPILENLGFHVVSERTFELSPELNAVRRPVYLHDCTLQAGERGIAIADHRRRLEAGFLAVWSGLADNDLYNGLILQAGLEWREAALIRAYAAFLGQTGAPFGQSYLAQTLNRNGPIVRDLMHLFRARFDPASGGAVEERRERGAKIVERIEAALADVPLLDDERVLRHFLNMIQAALRTNFYQRNEDGGVPETIAVKFRSALLDGLPPPKPYAEIFVYSPRFEGVHLRGGAVARGGLRWSDRAQDFRTEVLSLAKAQNVKNVVIVPQGAKGGFVPKMLPAIHDRDAIQAEGIACYKLFVSSLLSLTDNLVDGKPQTPRGIVCHDSPDPYLVVAADKGTAAFSDIANGIALERGFWLGDAFASGGSAGYDHKKMGITARGAWEAVKRHFREMDVDIQTTPFRVAGVGDMSGDVFGNGMLLSKAIRLVAAFDHRDIFIDPDPDPAASWEERKRLFELPRSSWRDYSRALISKGGGVLSRQAKFIELPEEARALLGLGAQETPAAVMSAILRLDVDLLWFGGIGTYVRGVRETNEQAGDRANDAIRVTAADLRAKVIGEGANLGMTQRARVEFALRGGRLNSDAIDNSAGVNTSDVEVNIKIALSAAVAKGRLGLEERNALLQSMTGAVADIVPRNNYLQTLAISLEETRGLAELGFHRRFMNKLEAAGHLDRKLEGLPGEAELAEREQARQPLTRPELALLLAYAKIGLNREILASAVPDDPYLSRSLSCYFPPEMRERFAAEIAAHPLRREIIATTLANEIINRGGSAFAMRLAEETGREPEDIAFAFAIAMAVFDLNSLYDAIDALDGKIPGERQLSLYRTLQDRQLQAVAWFLRHGRFSRGLTAEIELYEAGVRSLNGSLGSTLGEKQKGNLAGEEAVFASWGAPQPLASRLAALGVLAPGLEIVAAARKAGKPEADLARVFFEIDGYFHLDELKHLSGGLGRGDYYERLAVDSTLETIAAFQRDLAQQAVVLNGDGPPDFARWRDANAAAAARAKDNLKELIGGGLTLAKLTVAVTHLRDLVMA